MLADHERSRIEHTLLREREQVLDAIEHFDERKEELRDRANPGQLFEQALDYARSSGGAVRRWSKEVRCSLSPQLSAYKLS